MNQRGIHQIVSWGQYHAQTRLLQQGKILQMHVGIPGKEREKDQFKKIHHIQTRSYGVPLNSFRNLLIAAMVFVFG